MPEQYRVDEKDPSIRWPINYIGSCYVCHHPLWEDTGEFNVVISMLPGQEISAVNVCMDCWVAYGVRKLSSPNPKFTVEEYKPRSFWQKLRELFR